MKVLIQMGDSYPDESPCAKRMRTFHDILSADGNTVIVLAPKTEKSITGNPDTIYCPTIKMKKKTVLYRLLNSVVFAITSFFKALTVKKVDVVITTSPPPLINLFGWAIARLKRAKLVYDVRDIWPDVAWEMGSFDEHSFYSKVFAVIRNFMLKHADLTIAVSPGKVRKLKTYCPQAKIIEITNGLDEEFLSNELNQEVVQKYELDKYFTISYIGNLGLAQGLKQLLEVAKKAKTEYPKVRFLLYGSGAEEELLKTYVAQNHLTNVQFPGRIPNKAMYTVLRYSKMNFVSLVNENLQDSVPTKMYEALGVGCPVLLSACGDAARILQESGLGMAVTPNHTEELWEAYKEMYEQIESYQEKADAAKAYILENYSRQKAAKQFEAELESMFAWGQEAKHFYM